MFSAMVLKSKWIWILKCGFFHFSPHIWTRGGFHNWIGNLACITANVSVNNSFQKLLRHSGVNFAFLGYIHERVSETWPSIQHTWFPVLINAFFQMFNLLQYRKSAVIGLVGYCMLQAIMVLVPWFFINLLVPLLVISYYNMISISVLIAWGTDRWIKSGCLPIKFSRILESAL